MTLKPIAEAATRPTMRFVALKTEAQLDVQILHRVRDRLCRPAYGTSTGNREGGADSARLYCGGFATARARAEMRATAWPGSGPAY